MTNPARGTLPTAGGSYDTPQRGYVRDRNDPDKLGRVRVFCPGVMGEQDNADSWLGWAAVRGGRIGSDIDATVDAGETNVPELNTPVWIEFEDHHPDFPVITGTWVPGVDAADSGLPKLGKGQTDPTTVGEDKTADGITVPKSAANPTYPDNRVVKTRDGFVVELDSTAGGKRARIRHPSGTFAEITNPGNLVKQIVGDFLLWAGSTIKWRAVSHIMLSTGGRVYLAGSDASATKKAAHEDSRIESHTHTIAFVLTSPSGAVSGTITAAGADAKISAVTCTDNVKVKP